MDVVERDYLSLDSWKLRGELPEKAESHPEPPLNNTEVQLAKRANFFPSKSARCVAREIGEFLATNQRFPLPHVQRFIVAACGSTGQFGFQDFGFEPSQISVENALDDVALDQSKIHETELAVEFGAWSGVRAGEGYIVVAFGRHRAELNPYDLTPDTQFFDLKGRTQGSSGSLRARATSGPTGVVDCISLPGFEAPRFHIRCPLDKTQPNTTYEIGVVETSGPTRIIVGGMVFLNSEQQRNWISPGDSWPSTEPKTTQQYRQEVHRLLNTIRSELGLKHASLETEQSKQVDTAFPHWLGFMQKDPEQADHLIRGLKAGWLVNRDIVGSAWRGTCSGRTPQDLVSAMLSSPSGRAHLTRDNAGSFAIGIYKDPKNRWSCALFLSFTPLPDESHEERVDRFLSALNQKRAERGLPRARLYKQVKAVAAEFANRVESGKQDPEDAGDAFTRYLSLRWKTEVRGTGGLTSDLNRIAPNHPLLTKKNVRGSIFIAPYRTPNHPFTRYVVVFAFKD